MNLPRNPMILKTKSQGEAGSVELKIYKIESGKRVNAEMEIIARKIGFSMEPNNSSLYVYFLIPEDKVTRSSRINSYVTWLESESQKRGYNNVFLTRDKAEIIAGLEKMYIENQTGEFELSCSYNFILSNSRLVKIESPPVRFNIYFKGHFFDVLKQ